MKQLSDISTFLRNLQVLLGILGQEDREVCFLIKYKIIERAKDCSWCNTSAFCLFPYTVSLKGKHVPKVH